MWHRITVGLVETFSMSEPPSSHRRRQPHDRWRTASVALTVVLVIVVAALSCCIFGVITILYRRQYFNSRVDLDRGYGITCSGSNGGPIDDAEEVGKIIVAHQNQDALQPSVHQEHPSSSTRSSHRRQPEDYATDDTSNNNHTDVTMPLLQQQQYHQQVRYQSKEETKNQPLSKFPLATQHNCSDNGRPPIVVVKNTIAAAKHDDGTGPDIVMSTATALANTGIKISNFLKYSNQII